MECDVVKYDDEDVRQRPAQRVHVGAERRDVRTRFEVRHEQAQKHRLSHPEHLLKDET